MEKNKKKKRRRQLGKWRDVVLKIASLDVTKMQKTEREMKTHEGSVYLSMQLRWRKASGKISKTMSSKGDIRSFHLSFIA